MKTLFKNLTICVEKEGAYYRAYAFNAQTDECVASAKSTSEYYAANLLFMTLREGGLEKCQN